MTLVDQQKAIEWLLTVTEKWHCKGGPELGFKPDFTFFRGQRIEIPVVLEALNAYRNQVLGKDFQITFPEFPAGAYCSWPRQNA